MYLMLVSYVYVDSLMMFNGTFHIGDSEVSGFMHLVSMTDDKKSPQVYHGVCLVSMGVQL